MKITYVMAALSDLAVFAIVLPLQRFALDVEHRSPHDALAMVAILVMEAATVVFLIYAMRLQARAMLGIGKALSRHFRRTP